MDESMNHSGAGQYLTFFVGGDEYAVGILRIREILEFAGATRVPGAPPGILGVINLRGKVVPVVDLAAKFELPPAELTRRTCVVIVDIEVESTATVIGLVTDSVSQVIELAEGRIEPPPSFGTRAAAAFLKGVGKHGDRFVLILDVDELLSENERLAQSLLEDSNPVAEPAAAIA